jgi:hypothetical protein
MDEFIRDRLIIDKSWERKFDFIFIDGDHSYDSVMNNFEARYPERRGLHMFP